MNVPATLTPHTSNTATADIWFGSGSYAVVCAKVSERYHSL